MPEPFGKRGFQKARGNGDVRVGCEKLSNTLSMCWGSKEMTVPSFPLRAGI